MSARPHSSACEPCASSYSKVTTETMLYDMPCCQYPAAKELEIAFAIQKNHISFYVLKQR